SGGLYIRPHLYGRNADAKSIMQEGFLRLPAREPGFSRSLVCSRRHHPEPHCRSDLPVAGGSSGRGESVSEAPRKNPPSEPRAISFRFFRLSCTHVPLPRSLATEMKDLDHRQTGRDRSHLVARVEFASRP